MFLDNPVIGIGPSNYGDYFYSYDAKSASSSESECKIPANLSDAEIIYLLKDKEDEFVVKINLAQKLKDKDPLRYLREIKNLILDNKEYMSLIIANRD